MIVRYPINERIYQGKQSGVYIIQIGECLKQRFSVFVRFGFLD